MLGVTYVESVDIRRTLDTTDFRVYDQKDRL